MTERTIVHRTTPQWGPLRASTVLGMIAVFGREEGHDK